MAKQEAGLTQWLNHKLVPCDAEEAEAAAGDDDGDDVPALVVERRRKRRAKRQATFAGGDDKAKATAARDAALTFLDGQPQPRP